MLPASRIMSFLDRKNNYVLHFLEGQKLVQDLLMTQLLKGEGFHYFRNTVLTLGTMLTLLKQGEGLGLYIDSDEPFFRLKVEIDYQGQMRALLFPADFNLFPDKIKGQARLVKGLPDEKAPYVSIVALKGHSFDEIVNELLLKSYQIQAKILLGQQTDHSLMILKLPEQGADESGPVSLERYIELRGVALQRILDTDTDTEEKVQGQFSELQIDFLKSRQIEFRCSCSRLKMIRNLFILRESTNEDLFGSTDHLEVSCDFCKTKYLIYKNDLSPAQG